MSLISLLHRTHSVNVRSEISAEVNYYLDPVLGTAMPRAPLLASIDASFGPRWSAGAFLNFTTDVTWTPQAAIQPATGQGLRNGGYPDETVFSAGIPVRYRMGQLLFVELSGRLTLRAPHLRVPAEYFRWGETEIWAILTLSAASRFSSGPS